MQLSIIIPVYNIEIYIEKCLESVLIPNVEIIVINDGSRDSSLEIIKSFVENNKNYSIKIINQENKGLAETRNVGLEASSGKYIWFVDGDDYIENVATKEIIDLIGREAIDVYSFGYNVVESTTEELIRKMEYSNETEMGINNKLKLTKNLICNVWRYIVRKDFLIENNIKFRKDKVCEDIEWCIKVFSNIKEMKILNVNLYNYRQNRDDSIMSNVSLNRMVDVFENISYAFDYVNNTNVNRKIKKILLMNLYKQYLYNTYNINLMKKEDIDKFFVTSNYSFFKVSLIKVLMRMTKGYKYLRS